MKSMLDRLVSDAENSAEIMNFENQENYCEQFESLDITEQLELQDLEGQEVQNLINNKGMSRLQAKIVARGKANQVAKAIQSGALAKVPSAPSNPFQPMQRNVRGQKVAATFTINIKRLTAAIANTDLPVILFGKTFSLTAYVTLLTALLPAGVALTAVQVGAVNTDDTALTGTTANAFKVRFCFTQGLNVDIIEVTCNEVPMPTFVDSTATDSFSVENFRYKISDTTKQAQYDNPVSFKRKTMFGQAGEQVLTPSTYINPTDFKDNLIKIAQPFEIDKDSWIETKINATANFQVSLSFSVSKFVRQGANLL